MEVQDINCKPRILIADDQADVLQAIRLLLKLKKYKIEFASSVSEIIEIIQTRTTDLVLMDINYVRGETSDQQGLNLISRIKQIDNTISITVMTAWSRVELAVEAMRRGAQDFTGFPFRNAQLAANMVNHHPSPGRD